MRASRRQHGHELVQGFEGLVELEFDGEIRKRLQIRTKGRVVIPVIPTPARAALVIVPARKDSMERRGEEGRRGREGEEDKGMARSDACQQTK